MLKVLILVVYGIAGIFAVGLIIMALGGIAGCMLSSQESRRQEQWHKKHTHTS